MADDSTLEAFEGCPASGGYHCQTSSLAKIFRFHGHPLSEEMLLGLGAGMGFVYWKTKTDGETQIFIGGRGNNKGFFGDLGSRTGVRIGLVTTSSAKKAEYALLESLRVKEPVMLFGDMGFLPWFDFPEGYHFGGHSFVVCGYDGAGTVLASDMDPRTGGLKKGLYYPISLEQLAKARASPYRPFPPKNGRLEFDFPDFRRPAAEDVYASIRQEIESQLAPPTRNFGIKGIRCAAGELPKWPGLFPDAELRAKLFDLYVFIEIGGTGGGCFRYMYSRFLRECASLAGNEAFKGPADSLEESGRRFSRIAALFKDAFGARDLGERLGKASALFGAIADIEEGAFAELSRIVG